MQARQTVLNKGGPAKKTAFKIENKVDIYYLLLSNQSRFPEKTNGWTGPSFFNETTQRKG